ncbi:MAG: biotin--[acetyl-CoA-carboxylase] ligase [Lachnospiraceae bacterium]|nr:biotin--[acetyl-CoA-carboxylase] ligase [Lachnospiraceae bacterium]
MGVKDRDLDRLVQEEIMLLLMSADLVEDIQIYPEIDSTNREAKAQVEAGATHGTVILAERQIAGKGRQGRSFFSPRGTGLYMSFVLDSKQLGFHNPVAITAYAAVCVCETIEKICHVYPVIKWVNDVFLNSRKICGILTEVITVSENEDTNKMILGIGINVSVKQEDFPKELRDIATSIYPEGTSLVTRNQLAAEIINRVLCADKPDEAKLFLQYKARLFMLNTEIIVVQGKEKYKAISLDVNEYGQLIVRTLEGEIKTLVFGEVQIL